MTGKRNPQNEIKIGKNDILATLNGQASELFYMR